MGDDIMDMQNNMSYLGGKIGKFRYKFIPMCNLDLQNRAVSADIVG